MKKISHIWSIICTTSSTDREKNNISLFNLVENFTVRISKTEAEKIKDKNNLLIPFNQEFISRFYKNAKGENVIFDLRIDVITPKGKLIENKDTKTINFDKKFNNIRITNRIGAIPTEGSGLYHFSLKIKEVGETEFVEVNKLPIEINIEFEK